MNLNQILRILLAWKKLILGCTVLALLAGVAVAYSIPSTYEATARVMLDVVKPDPTTGEIINTGTAKSYVKSQVELIKDYRVAGEVVDRLGWPRSTEALQAYNKSGSNMEYRRWLSHRLIDNLKVVLVEGSNILEITYTAASAEMAANVANTIRQTYMDHTVAARRESSARSSEFYRAQLENLRSRLINAERRKADFERANGIFLTDDSKDSDMARLEALAGAQPTIIPATPAPAPIGGGGPAAAQLAGIDAQIAAASRTLGSNHPELVALRNQRAALASAAARERVVARPSGTPAVNTTDQLAAMYNAQQAKVLANRGKVAEAKRLAADVTALTNQYDQAAAREAELEQQAQSTGSSLTPLGIAVAPRLPTSPNRPLIILATLALGLLAGLGGALVLELLDRRIRCADDLASLGVPVVGAMPKLKRATA